MDQDLYYTFNIFKSTGYDTAMSQVNIS